MDTQSFEIAPRSRVNDWDKALAFAIAPAAPTFAAIYYFAGGLPLALIVTAACFVGTFLCALTLASTPLGRLLVTEQALVLDSGHLHASVQLTELDLGAARLGDTNTAALRLQTRLDHAVTIPRRDGSAIVVTPLFPDEFLRALRAAAA